MKPVAIDTAAFLRACAATTFHDADGGATTEVALWWRLNHAVPGATWHISWMGAYKPGGPAVVDDFGDLVLAGVRP